MAEHDVQKIVDDGGEVFNFRDPTKQPVADRVTSWSSTPSDTKYPSEKLVKTSLDAKATDSAVLHKAGLETVSGQKWFEGGFCVFNSSNVGYGHYTLPGTGAGTKYDSWPEEYKDGAHFREWRLSFNTGVNFWGKLRITIATSYSSFNASGSMQKTINCAFNTAQVFNNTGYYNDLGINTEKEFRISDLIWNNTTECWEIKIHSIKPTSNNSVPVLLIEFWTYSTTHRDSALGIHWVSTTPDIVTDTTYYTKRAGNASTSPGTSGEQFNWEDTPVQQSPYGYEIFNRSHTIPVGNGGTGKSTAKAAEYNLTTGKSEISETTSGDDRVVFELASPSESNGVTRGFRKLSTIWTWIKSKLTGSDVNIGGNAATATTATTAAGYTSGGAIDTALQGKQGSLPAAGNAMTPVYVNSSHEAIPVPTIGRLIASAGNSVIRFAFANTDSHNHTSIRLQWAGNSNVYEAIVAVNHAKPSDSTPGTISYAGMKLIAFNPDATSENIPIAIKSYGDTDACYVYIVWRDDITYSKRVKFDIVGSSPASISGDIVALSSVPSSAASHTIKFIPQTENSFGSAVGSATKPVFVDTNGLLKECGNSLAVSVTGTATTAAGYTNDGAIAQALGDKQDSLGISSSGNAGKFLNEKGQWVKPDSAGYASCVKGTYGGTVTDDIRIRANSQNHTVVSSGDGETAQPIFFRPMGSNKSNNQLKMRTDGSFTVCQEKGVFGTIVRKGDTTGEKVVVLKFDNSKKHSHSSVRLNWAYNTQPFEMLISVNHSGSSISHCTAKVTSYNTFSVHVPKVYYYSGSAECAVFLLFSRGDSTSYDYKINYFYSGENSDTFTVDTSDIIASGSAQAGVYFVPQGQVNIDGSGFSGIGSDTKPVYVGSDGQVKECGQSLAVNVTGASSSCTGNAASATIATTASKLGSSNVGGATKPIYLLGGTPTECYDTREPLNISKNIQNSGYSSRVHVIYWDNSGITSTDIATVVSDAVLNEAKAYSNVLYVLVNISNVNKAFTGFEGALSSVTVNAGFCLPFVKLGNSYYRTVT